MTKKEFIEQCSSLGYCSKAVAKQYAGAREQFTDNDFIEVFRFAEKRHAMEHGDSPHGKRVLENGGRTTKQFTVHNGHNEH